MHEKVNIMKLQKYYRVAKCDKVTSNNCIIQGYKSMHKLCYGYEGIVRLIAKCKYNYINGMQFRFMLGMLH